MLRTLFFILLSLILSTKCYAIEWTPSSSFKYRMTVVIDTPEGSKTGSAVREVFNSGGLSLFPEQGSVHMFDGEAVAIDLGKRGLLFALPDTDYGYGFETTIFRDAGFWQTWKLNKPISISVANYPKFVRFRDLNDPASREDAIVIRRECCRTGHTRATSIDDHMEEMFGKGVKIREVTLEITDDPVTRNLTHYLTWVPCLTQTGRLHGRMADNLNLSDKRRKYLSSRSFVGLVTYRELEKKNLDCSAFWNLQADYNRAELNALVESTGNSTDAQDQYNLGRMYSMGKGAKADQGEALKWYQKAADRGYVPAYVSIANIYWNGRGFPQNYEEGLKWYIKAAEAGYVPAQRTLGRLYERGDGVPQDYKEAYFWGVIATRNSKTHRHDKEVYDKIGSKLSPDDKNSIEKRVADWQQAHPAPATAIPIPLP